MTTEHLIPPLRELPTGSLAARKQHLLAEISGTHTPMIRMPGLTVPHRRLVAVAAVVAGCLAAVAVAASGGWLFASNGQQIIGVTHVTLAGRSWRVTLKQQPEHNGVARLLAYASSGTTTSVRAAGLMSTQFVVKPFTALRVDVPGGEVWAGTTRSTIRTISITYYSGRVYSTNTIAAPHATKTPYRYWTLAVPGVAPAASFTTRDVNGKSIHWRGPLSHG
jgi:hypothetical protein